MQKNLAPLVWAAFRAVNLRKDRTQLTDTEMAVGTNVDTHEQDGVIQVRRGVTEQFVGALAGLDIRKITTVGSRRYRIADRSIYRNETEVRSSTLHTGKRTTMLAYQPDNDNNEYCFIADKGEMRKDDGSNNFRWGGEGPVTPIGDPLQFPVGPYGIFGALDSSDLPDYKQGITYIRWDLTVENTPLLSLETNPTVVGTVTSTNAITSALDAGYAELILRPQLADPQFNGFGVYRTVSGGSILLFENSFVVKPSSRFSVMFGWETVILAEEYPDIDLTFKAVVAFQPFYPTAGPTGLSVGFAALLKGKFFALPIFRTTQIWEPGYRAEAAEGVIFVPAEAYDNGRLVQNSESSDGRHGTYLWEYERGFVANANTTLYYAYGRVNFSDAELAFEAERNNNPPPKASFACESEGVIFVGNTTDIGGRNHVHWSKRFRPEVFPPEQFVAVGYPSDEIMGLVSSVGIVGVITRRAKYRLVGDPIRGFVPNEAISRRGTPASDSVVTTERGVIFVAYDGVYVSNFLSPDQSIGDDIFPLFIGDTVNGYAPINLAAIETISGGFYRGRYYMAYPSNVSITPDTIAVYSFTTNGWTFQDLALRSFYYEDDTQDFIGGGLDGKTYILNEGTFDGVETPISIEVELGDREMAQSVRALYLYAKIDAVCPRPLTLEFLVDGVSKHTVTIVGNREKRVLRLPQGCVGHRMRVRMTYSGPVGLQVFSVHVYGTALQPV